MMSTREAMGLTGAFDRFVVGRGLGVRDSCWSTFLFLFLLLLFPAKGLSQQPFIPSIFSSVSYQIEDLSANFSNDKALLVVSGNVKNLGGRAISGSVIVYLKGKSDEVLIAFEGPVNNSVPITYGAAGGFEVSANVSGYPQVSSVSVEFVPSQPPVTAKSP